MKKLISALICACLLFPLHGQRAHALSVSAQSAVLIEAESGKIIYENDKTFSPLSDLISADLKSRGMRFVGTTIIYSYLQAVGVINSHDDCCFLHK